MLFAGNSLAQWRGAVPQALISTYRALGGGWQLREGHDYVPEAVKEQMRQRTDWGSLLAAASSPENAAPDSTIRAPQW